MGSAEAAAHRIASGHNLEVVGKGHAVEGPVTHYLLEKAHAVRGVDLVLRRVAREGVRLEWGSNQI